MCFIKYSLNEYINQRPLSPSGVSWRQGEPPQSDICSAAGSSEKETATTRTPRPFSYPKQFCSGPKFAYLTQPNGPCGGELTVCGEGRLVTCFHLTCPTELSPSYLEKLPLSPAQLRLELLAGRKLCSSPSSDSTSIFQCCIYICALSEHWSGWHTPLFGASSRQLQQSVRTPSSVWLPLCLPEFLTAGPPSVSSQPSARHVNNRITAQPWKE